MSYFSEIIRLLRDAFFRVHGRPSHLTEVEVHEIWETTAYYQCAGFPKPREGHIKLVVSKMLRAEFLGNGAPWNL